MYKIKRSVCHRLISCLLIFSFISLDLSSAYPIQHSPNTNSLAVPLASQTLAIKDDANFRASILCIAEYLLGNPEKGINPLPLKYLSYVIQAELGGVIHEIDLEHISFYNGIISIPVVKNGRKFIVQLTLKNMPSLQGVEGNELSLSNTYAIRITSVNTGPSFRPDKSEDTGHLIIAKVSTKNVADITQELQNALERLDRQSIDNMLSPVGEDNRLHLFYMVDTLINEVGFINASPQLRYSFVKLLTCGDKKMVNISAVLSQLSKQKLITLFSNPQDIDFASVAILVLLSVVDRQGFTRINNTGKLTGAPKVLLVGPYKIGDVKIGQFLAPPIGAHRIASFLEVFGIEVDVYDTDLSGMSGLEKLVREKKYDFIGFSMLHPTLSSDIKLMYHMKKLSPKSIFIAGGQGAAFNYDILLNKASADIVVRGFGEFPMLNFVMSFDESKDLMLNYRNIRGIYLRDKGGKIIKTDFAKQYTADDMHVISLIWDTAAIPYETYWQYMRGQYTDEHLKVMRNEGMLNTVRIYTESHCPMGCAFCSSTRFCDDAVGGTQKVILLSAEDIIRMIKEVVRAHPEVNSIYFNDDNFMINRDRVNKLCDLIEKELSGRKLNFFALSRVDMVDYNILKRMQQVGFKMIIYGAESFSNKILEDMHKNVRGGDQAAVALRAVEDTVRAGLIARLNLILFYPTARLEDIKVTIDESVKLMELGAIMDPFTYVEAYSGAKITTQGFETLSSKFFIEGTGQEIEVPDIILPQDPDVRKVSEAAIKLKPTIDEEIKSKYGWKKKLPAPVNSLSLFKAIYVVAGFDTSKIDELIAKLMPKPTQFDARMIKNQILIDGLIRNNLPDEYQNSFDIPNLPLDFHREGPQLRDHLQAMLNVLDNPDAYKEIPWQYRDILRDPANRRFFEYFILLHDIGKTKILPETVSEEGRQFKLYPRHEAKSVEMIDFDSRLAGGMSDRDVLREVVKLHGALYFASSEKTDSGLSGAVTPEDVDKFIKDNKIPENIVEKVIPLLIACDFLDVIGTHRPDPFQIRVWRFAQAYPFRKIWARTVKAKEIKNPKITKERITTKGTATTVIIGSPFPGDIIKKLEDIQGTLSAKLKNKFSPNNPESLHISVETIADTDEDALSGEQKDELTTLVQGLANSTSPFNIRIKGITVAASGAVMAQCYMETYELLNIRAKLNEKFKIKDPKNIIHITLGYVTEPLDQKEFSGLIDMVKTHRADDLGQFTASGLSIVFDSGQIFSKDTNEFLVFPFFTGHNTAVDSLTRFDKAETSVKGRTVSLSSSGKEVLSSYDLIVEADKTEKFADRFVSHTAGAEFKNEHDVPGASVNNERAKFVASGNNLIASLVRNDVKAAMDFLAASDELPERCDALMVLGSSNPEVPRAAARLYKKLSEENRAPGTVLFSGKEARAFSSVEVLKKRLNNSEKYSHMKTEAEIFHSLFIDELHAVGFKSEDIKCLLEMESRDTGQNMNFSKRLLEDRGIKPQFDGQNIRPVNVILMQTPAIQRRAKATFEKEFGGGWNCSSYAHMPDVSRMDDSGLLVAAHKVITEIEKFESYGPEGHGYIVKVEIPAEVSVPSQSAILT